MRVTSTVSMTQSSRSWESAANRAEVCTTHTQPPRDQMRAPHISPRINLFTMRLIARMNPAVEGASATSCLITWKVYPLKPGED